MKCQLKCWNGEQESEVIVELPDTFEVSDQDFANIVHGVSVDVLKSLHVLCAMHASKILAPNHASDAPRIILPGQ